MGRRTRRSRCRACCRRRRVAGRSRRATECGCLFGFVGTPGGAECRESALVHSTGPVAHVQRLGTPTWLPERLPGQEKGRRVVRSGDRVARFFSTGQERSLAAVTLVARAGDFGPLERD